MTDDVIKIGEYKDTPEFKGFKSEIWQQAKQGQPFTFSGTSAAEYRYFHKFYEISKLVVARQMSNEEAARRNEFAYQEFINAKELWERHVFDIMETDIQNWDAKQLVNQLQECMDRIMTFAKAKMEVNESESTGEKNA